MEKNHHGVIAKRLGVIWVISYAVMAIVSTIYTHSQTALGDFSHTSPASPYQLITTFLVALYFIPLLFGIHHHAKKAEIKWMLLAVRIAICFLLYWLICVFVMWYIHFS